MRPVDAIVIAYGTNEAVDNISFADYSRRLSRVVSRLRAVAPGVEIVVVTAPSFAKGGGACPASRPRSLQSVISAQLAAGQWPGVQVWNWMDAMGGCVL
jgi:lysophospholipase L1-like esterase